MAVVFTRYIMLVWQNVGLPAKHTEGQLFFKLFDEMQECSFDDALFIVIRVLKKAIVHFDNSLFITATIFFARLPLCFTPLLNIFSCET